MVIAPKGHFRTQMPHPTQRFSVITGLPSTKTMVSSPVRTGGQKYSHSLEHFFGWQRSRMMMEQSSLQTSVEKKRPGDQPKVDDHELHIEPILGLESCCIYLKEGIGILLD